MTEEKLIHDDVERTYLKYIPTQFKNVPINLVIGLHGYTGSASGFEKETTGMFNLSAEKYNFIGIYPQGDFIFIMITIIHLYHHGMIYLLQRELVQIERYVHQML